MISPSAKPLSFEEFRELLADTLLIEEERLVPQASLANDLCVDSLRWVDLALRMEEMGAQIPTDAFWEIQTVEDAYRVYLDHAPR